MSFLTHMDLLAGLVMLVGTTTLIMTTAHRPPKALSDEIAHRVETTIAVLDECGAGPRR